MSIAIRFVIVGVKTPVLFKILAHNIPQVILSAARLIIITTSHIHILSLYGQ